MTKDPAVLFYTSDFLTGTSFFTMEERGQYITLLCQQHQLGVIPKNHMINICKSNDSPVIKKFEQDCDGNYYNKRMREEAEKRKSFCLSRSNNKSGRKSKGKNKITSKSYDNHKIIHMENDIDNINIINNNKDNKYYKFNDDILDKLKLTEIELNKLYSVYDEREIIDIMNELSLYIGSKGEKYKSHYMTILSWVRRKNIKTLKDKERLKNAEWYEQ